MMKFAALALPLFLASTPVLAGEATTAQPAVEPVKAEKPKKDKNDPDRKICRVFANSASSRVATRRVCKTQAQWADEAKGREGNSGDAIQGAGARQSN